jgi:hypothetical protein
MITMVGIYKTKQMQNGVQPAVKSKQTIPEAAIQRKAGNGLLEECFEHCRDSFCTMCWGNVAASQMLSFESKSIRIE